MHSPLQTAVKHLWGPLRTLFRNMPEKRVLVVLSIATGLLCGLAAVGLKLAIHGIQTGLSTLFHGSRWPWIFLPGAGMLLSWLIVHYIVKDNIGHGVTKVLQAVSKNESKIRSHNLWSSLLTSALTIGFGGSVGAEAPIVYTGAAIGSNLARRCKLSYRGMTLLLGCGAAGALAGIFNAPLSGVLFTLEILLFNISMSSILPLMLSSVSATLVSYLCLGRITPFTATLVEFSMRNVPYYILLGVFCAFCALYFLRTTLALEDLMGKLRNHWLRWLLCAAALGGMVYMLPPLLGEGYGSIATMLNGTADGAIWFFVLVLLLKVFSMTFTNAGGGVGGTFGPTLFMGAVAGFVMASTVNMIKPDSIPVANFVLVGMAGLMAGVMQAPLTAIFLIAEITGGYQLLVPLILTASISFGVMRLFEKYSIYTKRIAASGELLTHDSDQAVLTLLKLPSLLETDFESVQENESLGSLVKAVSRSERNIFPVLDRHGHFVGYVLLSDIRSDMFDSSLYKIRHVYNYMRQAPEYVFEDEPMEDVMRKFEKSGAWNLPVLSRERKYLGFLSKSKIFNAYREELKDFSQD